MLVTCLRVAFLVRGWMMQRADGGSASSLIESAPMKSSSSDDELGDRGSATLTPALSPPALTSESDPPFARACLRLLSRAKSTLKMNLVPLSSSDSKSISPPRHSMIDLVMTKPNPVPFSFAALWSAGWQNGTNSVCCFAAGMPTPLSAIEKVIMFLSLLDLHCWTSMENSTSPVRPSTFELYLMALSTRLTQHCLRRKKSPTSLVLKCSGDVMEKMRSTPLLDAFCEMSITCSTSCRRVNTSSESSMVALLPPDLSLAPSNLAKSRIWLMRPNSASALVSEALMNDSVNSVSSPDSIARVLKPMMELSGVRSSCVMLKKNARCTRDI
mmetsp:Transcript_6954/g.28789  ORF Transcript_6954/g.28789 Transcript_6954/m.28789 type:complete len:328 (+) Transcript_6954:1161-2144(+)